MGFTESRLEMSMRAERQLESECAQAIGDPKAAQRIMARAEKRMFEDMMIVREMLPELRKL
jgi:hypothetical protein